MKKVIDVKGSVIIIKQRKETTTKGGIILTQASLEGGSMEEFEGEIMAVGPLVSKFKVGEVVSFGKHAGSIKSWEKQEYWLLFEHAINTAEKVVGDDYELKSSEFIVNDNVEGE